jgi:hypothetical protein
MNKRFDFLAQRRKEEQHKQTPQADIPNITHQQAERVDAVASTIDAEPQETPRRVGRPAGGKKSNAEYQQVTAYIRKRTYRRVQIQLLEQDAKQDFSELVEELLAEWLEQKSKGTT